MAATEPRVRNLADLYDLGPLEFTPEDAYAVATRKPGGATRWTF